jgi:hypothetical protein
MKKNEIKVGGLYRAKVSDKVVTVRIDSTHGKGGWNATNTATGKRIRIKSAQRLRGAVKGGSKAKGATKTKTTTKATTKKAKSTKATSEKKPKRVSALAAAAQVLAKAGKPMRVKELIAAMSEQGLWKSPGGRTPHATLYAAMLRESRDKGSASRFKRVDRGQFAFNG